MKDLLIIGPGRLGLLIASGFKLLAPESRIFLKFRSDNADRTKKLEADGFSVLTNNQDIQVENVVFCAPPTGNDHYAKDVEAGFKYLRPGGLYIFTSSGSVMAENSGGTVNEESPRVRTERSGKLMDAEDIVLEKDGCVLRLGGLYSLDSGAHNFYARGGEFNAKPGGFINLLHYEDAAEAALKCLMCNPKSLVARQLFLVADGQPLTRTQILIATKKCSLYKAGPEVIFTGGDDVDGKKYDVTKLRRITGWTPRYSSFADFMEQN